MTQSSIPSLSSVQSPSLDGISPEDIVYLADNIHKLSPELRQSLRTILNQKQTGCRTNKWMNFVRPSLHPKQRLFLSLDHREVMFGGAAGGSKSDSLLLSMMQYLDVPGYSSIIFRRTFKDLSGSGSIMDRAKSWFAPLEDEGVRWSASDNSFYFPTGKGQQPSRFAFAYLQHDDDKRNYQGWELNGCAFDELTQHPRDSYSYLFSRLRRLKGSGIPVRMRSACVPYGDVLTVNSGWKDIRDVRPGEYVYSMNMQGVLEEKRVLESYRTHFDGNLVDVSKKNLRMRMTPDHRVVYKKYSRNEADAEFRIIPWNQHVGNCISIARSPLKYDQLIGYTGETLGLSVNEYMAFLGIYLAEGCVNQKVRKGNYKVVITQSKARSQAEIKSLLDSLPWKFCWSKSGDFCACNKQLRSYLIQFGKAHQKFIPREILATASYSELEVLFKWMAIGDGSVRSSSVGDSYQYFTSSSQLADDVMEVGVKLGFKVTFKKCSARSVNHHDRYILYLTKERSNLTKIDKSETGRNDVSDVPYKGDVYCIKVEGNQNFVIRQSGSVWISGNTNPGGKFGDWVKEDFIPDEYLALSDNPDAQFSRVWEKKTDCGECRGTGIMDAQACIYCEGLGYRTRLFVPSRIQDNPSLDRAEYLRSLINLPPVERYRLEKGDWAISELGNLFKPEWVRYYSRSGDHFRLHRPDATDIIASIQEMIFFVTADTASKEKTSADYTCISTWAFHQKSGSIALIHVLMTRMEVPQIANAILNQSVASRASFVMVEDAQCGIGVLQELRGPKGKGLAVMSYSPHGTDKIARSTTAQIKMEAGQIYFPQGNPGWLTDPYAQMVGFPQATHDDFVDTLAMAAHWAHSRHQVASGNLPGILPPVGRYLSSDITRGLPGYGAY